MQTITISGKQFNVAPRYAAGHTLTENEAQALNQTMFENLRNNFATKAKEGASQEDFDTYAASYQFGVRTGGGSRQDPVRAEAMSLARDQVKAVIKAAGKNLSDYKAAAITTAAEKLLDSPKGAEILELAKKRVAEAQNAGAAEIDSSLLDMLNSAQTETATETAETASEEAPAEDSAPAAGRRK
jgi:ribosomal protein L16 Arg81 hydroxylase